MVTFNDINVVKGKFPNGEVDYLKITSDLCYRNSSDEFEVIFESNEDLLNLQVVKKMWDSLTNDARGGNTSILFIQFFPYSQMDREMDSHGFSLKAVAKLINELKFDQVVVADPHSSVLPALIDRLRVHYPVKDFLEKDKAENGDDGSWDLLFFPDHGAVKKYSEVLGCKNYRFGNKKRNLETGEIECYEVLANKEDIEGKDILVVDDLCAGGRTFVEAASALKAMGAANVDVYITHLMPQSMKLLKDIKAGNSTIRTLYSFNSLELTLP